MSKWQVVEKEDLATDWHIARYNDRVIQRFDDENKAINAAKEYLTSVNCDNSLTRDEKRGSVEAFMMTKQGCYLGVLDGEDWYMLDKNKKPVMDKKYYELHGKTEVAVRVVPGT